VKHVSQCILVISLGLLLTQSSIANENNNSQPEATPKPDFKPIAEVVKDAEKMEGFFTLYKTDEHLYMEIPSSRLNQSFLMCDTIVGTNVDQFFLSLV